MPLEPVPSRNLMERFVTGSLWMLVAAIALVMAVELLQSVWVQLVVAGGVMVGIVGFFHWWRWRSRGW